MRLPEINQVAMAADYSIQFKGLCRKMYVGENQFYDMKNLCATNYPVMTPRAKRATVRQLANCRGIIARNKLAWCANGHFYYDGSEKAAVTDTDKIMVGMGAYIIIFPDKIRFNISTGAVDHLDNVWTQNTGVTVTARLSRLNGEDYGATVSSTPPSAPALNSYWVDTSGDKDVLKVYTSTGWQEVAVGYYSVSAPGISAGFKVGDAVTISGADEAINGSHIIESIGTDYIVIAGQLTRTKTIGSGTTISRSAPDMDFICELNNRLWGCSNATHEIYASKLGDPTNWTSYGTGAAEAWSATVGSDGNFTAACSFNGSVLFWKEDMLHKIMGSKPSNFTVYDTPMRGVQNGSEKSIQIVNESLIYKSRDGVCIYDGGTPNEIGDDLGNIEYKNAVAGSLGDKYYLSMQDEENAWHLFVFNESKGMWHREDATHAEGFATLNGQLYMLTDGNLIAVRGREEAGATLEEDFDWFAETGDLLIEQADNKYIHKIKVRTSIEAGAWITIEAMYDSDGVWHQIYRKTNTKKMQVTVPIVPMRCDHMRLRISGHGRAAVYAISKDQERGSEL